MRLCSIASGSSGNCIYVGSDTTHLLVDTGISGKKVEFGLNSLDLTTGDLDGILVTHEHSDHIKGLGVVARKCGVPIYATAGTIRLYGSVTVCKESCTAFAVCGYCTVFNICSSVCGKNCCTYTIEAGVITALAVGRCS